jgi:glycosyltransferase involved in cell wall biosynthesis
MLPPIAWLPARATWQPGAGPDPTALDRALAAHGIDSVVIDPLRWPWNPFARHHPLLRGIDPLRALRVLLGWRRADAVLCVFEGPALPLVLLRRLLRFRPRLLMWDIGLTDQWRLRQRVQQLVVPRLDAILVLGSNQAGEIARRWPAHPQVHWIGHGIDTDFFQPLPRSGSGGIVAVGDDDGRDYPVLLDAVRGLTTAVTLRSAVTLDPPPNLRQLRERLSFPALRQLYADAEVVALPLAPRPHAGGVTTLLEASAMGCAIVVSDSPGLRDWCRDGETCLVVPCGDAAAMRGALLRLLADPDLRDRLGRSARAFAVGECSVPAFAARLAQALQARPGAPLPLSHAWDQAGDRGPQTRVPGVAPPAGGATPGNRGPGATPPAVSHASEAGGRAPGRALTDVSVIVPAHRGADFLPQALDAILSQTALPRDVILVDDGSPDHTPEVAARYAGRITYCRTENGGVQAARNHGVAQAAGAWIALCDQDDVWDPDYLEKHLALQQAAPDLALTFADFRILRDGSPAAQTKFEEAPAGFWPACTDQVLPAGLVLAPSFAAASIDFYPIFPSALMFRRALFDQLGGFDVSRRNNRAEDGDFVLRALVRCRFGAVPSAAATIRKHSANVSLDRAPAHKLALLLDQIDNLIYARDQDAALAPLHDAIASGIAKRRLHAAPLAFAAGDHATFRKLWPDIPPHQRDLKLRIKHLVSGLPDPIAQHVNRAMQALR